jgi:hypothetical protein
MVVALLMVWLYIAVSILIIIQTDLSARQRLKYGFGWPMTLIRGAWVFLKEIYKDTMEFLIACIEDK